MDQHRAFSVRLERGLAPLEFVLTVLVCFKDLRIKWLILFLCFSILITAQLVPEVKPDRQLEVKLDSATLHGST